MSNGKNLNLTPQCAAGVDTRRRVIELEKNDEDQWDAINQLRNRLPVWATMIISLLTFLLGCSITYAAIAKGGS
ncbi:hypothetical protein ES703_15242 [subsurface metagenome]